MKVLLIGNTALPHIEERFDLIRMKPETWLTSHVVNLQQVADIELSVCFPIPPEHTPVSQKIDGIHYYSYVRYPNWKKYEVSTEREFESIFRVADPDVIHCFGTEFAHTLAAIKAARNCGMIQRLVINIQGLVSVISDYHYDAGLLRETACLRTVRDILKRDSINNQKRNFAVRGQFERDAILKAQHVIGRTDWDRACTTQVNPEICYHFCNAILRESFYINQWSLEKCQRHSIFVSQWDYPVKGFHKILDALAIVIKKYPDTKLYTTGRDLLQAKTFLQKQRLSTYLYFLLRKIEKLGLRDHIVFLGSLDEQQMCQQFQKSHVFVSASTVENECISLGEGMILGLPCISSYVGGISNEMTHGEEGFLYPFDAPYMLAYYIDRIFSDDELALNISQKAKARASETYDRKVNAEQMVKIYRLIAQN